MKKIIISLLLICTFTSGFKGCFFDDTFLFSVLTSLLSGFRYYKTDGLFHYYYIIAGNNGKVYTNTNPKTDFWIERNSGTLNNLNCMKKVPRFDTAIVYAVGDNGTVIRSLDEGINWSVLNSPSTKNFNGIDILSNQIFIVGDSGAIVKTTNSGVNWSLLNSGVTKKLNSVYCINSFQTIAAGDNGTLLRTTDGGNNWQNINLPDTTANLNKISMMGTWSFGTILGIIGDNGKVYQSFDFINWTELPTGSNNNFHDMYFRNANSGFITGDNGAILYTTNAGINWSSDPFLNTLTNDKINSAKQLDDTTFAGVAGNRFIIFTSGEGILPVELTSFISVINGNDVILKWSSSKEINNSGFEIERQAVNGINEWIKIGFVSGNGTTEEPKEYSFIDNNLNSGKYLYRLKQIDFNGNFNYHDLNNEVVIGTPNNFTLSQNYPNPFNPATKIDFELPSEGNVIIKVYDVSGKLISNLLNENRPAGYYSITFNASNISSGVYFYKIEFNSNGRILNKIMKMMLAK